MKKPANRLTKTAPRCHERTHKRAQMCHKLTHWFKPIPELPTEAPGTDNVAEEPPVSKQPRQHTTRGTSLQPHIQQALPGAVLAPTQGKPGTTPAPAHDPPPEPKKPPHNEQNEDNTQGATPTPATSDQPHSHRPNDSTQPPQAGLDTEGTQQQTSSAAPQEETRPLTVLTLNVQGLTSALEDVKALAHKLNPDVMVLTETNLARQQRKNHAVRKRLPNYNVYLSAGEGRGQGVLIAVKKHFYRMLTVVQAPPIPGHEGNALQLTLVKAGCPDWHVVGIYMPPSLPSDRRQTLYTHLSALATSCKARNEPILLTGDWNATLYDEDRRSGRKYPADNMHSEFVQQTGLTPPTERLDKQGRRGVTYRKADGGTTSRLDDTYLSVRHGTTTEQHTLKVIKTHGRMTDHNALLCAVDCDTWGAQRPKEILLPQREPITQLAGSVTATDAANLRKALAEQCGTQIQSLRCAVTAHLLQGGVEQHFRRLDGGGTAAPADARQIHRLDKIGDQPARTVVEQLAKAVQDILTPAQQLAMELWETVATTPGGLHYRPRAASRQHEKLVKVCAKVDAATAALTKALHDGVGIESATDRASDTLAAVSHITKAEQDTQTADTCADGCTLVQRLREARHALKARIKEVDKKHAKLSDQKDKRHLRKLLKARQRLGLLGIAVLPLARLQRRAR